MNRIKTVYFFLIPAVDLIEHLLKQNEMRSRLVFCLKINFKQLFNFTFYVRFTVTYLKVKIQHYDIAYLRKKLKHYY